MASRAPLHAPNQDAVIRAYVQIPSSQEQRNVGARTAKRSIGNNEHERVNRPWLLLTLRSSRSAGLFRSIGSVRSHAAGSGTVGRGHAPQAYGCCGEVQHSRGKGQRVQHEPLCVPRADHRLAAWGGHSSLHNAAPASGSHLMRSPSMNTAILPFTAGLQRAGVVDIGRWHHHLSARARSTVSAQRHRP